MALNSFSIYILQNKVVIVKKTPSFCLFYNPWKTSSIFIIHRIWKSLIDNIYKHNVYKCDMVIGLQEVRSSEMKSVVTSKPANFSLESFLYCLGSSFQNYILGHFKEWTVSSIWCSFSCLSLWRHSILIHRCQNNFTKNNEFR